jgi:hypothetical protein
MGSEAALRERIGRLLAPLAPDPVREERSLVALVATAAIVAMAFGAVFGESLMGTLVGTLR